jgi:hypothetical protein
VLSKRSDESLNRLAGSTYQCRMVMACATIFINGCSRVVGMSIVSGEMSLSNLLNLVAASVYRNGSCSILPSATFAQYLTSHVNTTSIFSLGCGG